MLTIVAAVLMLLLAWLGAAYVIEMALGVESSWRLVLGALVIALISALTLGE